MGPVGRKNWGRFGEEEVREGFGKGWGRVWEGLGKGLGRVGEGLGKGWGRVGEGLGVGEPAKTFRFSVVQLSSKYGACVFQGIVLEWFSWELSVNLGFVTEDQFSLSTPNQESHVKSTPRNGVGGGGGNPLPLGNTRKNSLMV